MSGGTANSHPAFLYGVGHPIEASTIGVTTTRKLISFKNRLDFAG